MLSASWRSIACLGDPRRPTSDPMGRMESTHRSDTNDPQAATRGRRGDGDAPWAWSPSAGGLRRGRRIRAGELLATGHGRPAPAVCRARRRSQPKPTTGRVDGGRHRRRRVKCHAERVHGERRSCKTKVSGGHGVRRASRASPVRLRARPESARRWPGAATDAGPLTTRWTATPADAPVRCRRGARASSRWHGKSSDRTGTPPFTDPRVKVNSIASGSFLGTDKGAKDKSGRRDEPDDGRGPDRLQGRHQYLWPSTGGSPVDLGCTTRSTPGSHRVDAPYKLRYFGPVFVACRSPRRTSAP